ncbi:MAG TPA: Flp pilus assembly protein CpaB [Paenalcaligenes sp.]|nr:Flp pilus assembly protein CpaB [Paenalcaligenes sp.]
MTRFMKVAAIVLSVLALILIFLAMKLIFAPAPQPERIVVREVNTEEPTEAVVVETYPVVVALRDLAAGEQLSTTDLEVVHWPVQPQHSVEEAAEIVGQFLRFGVAAGEPLLTPNFKRGLAEHLAESERAVTIAVDEQIGAAHRIQAGDHVDVFFTLTKAGEVEHTQSRLLLAAARVLAYGNDTVDGPDKVEATGRAQSDSNARHAMLAVPLERVNELLMASRSGRLQLVLRSAADVAMPEPELFDAYTPLRGGRAGLNAIERAQLQSPENQAYAGLSLEAVAITDSEANTPSVVAQPSSTPTRSNSANRVQVIRSGKVSDEAY